MDVSLFLSRISFNLAYVMKCDLRKFEYSEKVHFCLVTYFKKVKLSYILDSLHVK